MTPYCARCGAPTQLADVEGRERHRCPDCGLVVYLDPKVAVAVVIIERERVLLGLRGAGTREPGKWSFPAGFAERGERLEEAAQREALEETGLNVQIDGLISLRSANGEPVVTAFYSASILSGTPTAADDLEALDWFPLAQPPELAFPHDNDVLAIAWSLRGR